MVNWVAIGIIVVILVLAVMVALDKAGVFGDDREGSSGTDRVQTEALRQGDYSVAWMKKHKQLTLPAKILAASVLVIVLAISTFAYLTLRSGSPVEVPYARNIQGTAIAVVGICGGVALANRMNAKRGAIEIVHEDESGNAEDTEIIYYDPDETVRNQNGRPVVQEHFVTRILGLFGRRKLVAHDRELRGSHSLLSDVVTHEIPEHAIKVKENRWLFRTQGRQVKTSPSSAADYYYRSPIQLHYEQYLDQQERLEKFTMRLDQQKAILGEAQEKLTDLQRKLETRDQEGREQAREEILEVIQLVNNHNTSYEIKQDTSRQRKVADQRDLSEIEPEANGGIEQ